MFRSTLVAVLTAILSSVFASSLAAEELANCRPFNGYGYFFERGRVTSDQAGWQLDAIINGELKFVRDGMDYDIILTNAHSRRSITANGFRLFDITHGAADQPLTLIAIGAGGGIVEHFLFDIDANGSGTVAWGTLRGHGSIVKSSVLVADCAPPVS